MVGDGGGDATVFLFAVFGADLGAAFLEVEDFLVVVDFGVGFDGLEYGFFFLADLVLGGDGGDGGAVAGFLADLVVVFFVDFFVVIELDFFDLIIDLLLDATEQMDMEEAVD